MARRGREGVAGARGTARRSPLDGIAAVPARLMGPMLVVVAASAFLLVLGFLMIYSASAPSALADTGDAAYFLKRQVGLAAGGLLLALAIVRGGYRRWCGDLLMLVSVPVLVLLLVTLAAGIASHGAQRWIEVAGVRVQPAEFAKVTVILAVAGLAERRLVRDDVSPLSLLGQGLAYVGAPVALVLFQPDKGSAGIIVLTVFLMLLMAGIPWYWVAGSLVACGVAFCVLVFRDAYSLSRVVAALDPWADPYGTGYQLVHGFFAFAKGGVMGVGVGFSQQKYSYIPEAHNDFIFAIVGEELGLVGTLGVVAAFAALGWGGFQVARHAPDLSGRLVAAGCTSLLLIQFLVNAGGVLGLIPLSGKPLPFLSYGGSSVVACVSMVALVVSVARASELPETSHDRRRRQMSLVGDAPARTVPQLRVHDGGRARQGRPPRIDLGPGPADRLRPRDGRR